MMKLLLCCCVVLMLGACKEKYEPPVSSSGTGYLVVEGFISPNGGAELHLSRTIPLSDTARMVNERSAQVRLEGNNGTTITLPETGIGVYGRAQLNLNDAVQYRLSIQTRDGTDYASDFVPVRHSPPIDSISWTRNEEGVEISVNTHDPQNNTWYYRWETEQTWEFHSLVPTVIDFDVNPGTGQIIGVKYRFPDMSPDLGLFYCWRTENSTSLLLGSSAKLSEDRMRSALVGIPARSWKLSVLYSIYVKQYALTKAEYEYLQIMKRNSEQNGSIFDPQPSELKGNIHCLTRPNEPVIGFIGITDRQEKRIWIRNSDVPGWNYFMACQSMDIPSDSAWAYPSMGPIGPFEINAFGKITRYTASDFICVDCRLRGTNIKPSFWP